MMQVIQKWKVTFEFRNHANTTVVFYVSDHHASNVLRAIADLDFSTDNGQPTSVLIEAQS